MKGFYLQSGATDYFSVLRVPSSERIPALAKTDRLYVHKILSAQIEYAIKYFNITNGLTIEQVFILADEIIDDSETDNLSIQDVFIFLHKLCTGKMGTVFNRLDVTTFMELFDVHRQERHQEVLKIRYEQQCNHKAMGDIERVSDNEDREKELTRAAIGDYLREKYKEV